MEKAYRNTLINSVDYLIEVRENVFAHALNLSMKNKLKEIDEVFEDGERYQFVLKHLDNSSDVNVQTIVNLIENIESTVHTLINVNVIKDDELKNEV